MDTNLLKKIQGLLSKTVDNGCSVAEAATSAALAQKLLDQHKLSIADISDYSEDEPIEESYVSSFSGARSITWKENLIYGLAKNNDCVMFLRKGCGEVKYVLVGRKSDTQIVDYMFNVLVREIERICKVEMARVGGRGKDWTNSFKVGAVQSIISNMNKSKTEIKSTATGQALIKIESRMTDVKKWVDSNLNLKNKSASTININGSAYNSGMAAGNKITVNSGLSGNTKMAKLLS